MRRQGGAAKLLLKNRLGPICVPADVSWDDISSSNGRLMSAKRDLVSPRTFWTVVAARRNVIGNRIEDETDGTSPDRLRIGQEKVGRRPLYGAAAREAWRREMAPHQASGRKRRVALYRSGRRRIVNARPTNPAPKSIIDAGSGTETGGGVPGSPAPGLMTQPPL